MGEYSLAQGLRQIESDSQMLKMANLCAKDIYVHHIYVETLKANDS